MLKVEAKDLTPVKFSDSKIAPVGNWIASAGTSDDPVAVGVMSVASRTLGRDNFIDPRNPKRGFLGIQMELATGDLKGVKLKEVTRRGPADKAGLKVNDILLPSTGRKSKAPKPCKSDEQDEGRRRNRYPNSARRGRIGIARETGEGASGSFRLPKQHGHGRGAAERSPHRFFDLFSSTTRAAG